MIREKMKDGTTKLSSGLSFNDIYPIGSIYISVVSTNPASFFGGTWEAFATGRTLIGVDPSQPEFDTAQETGGNKVHSHALSSPRSWAEIATTNVTIVAKRYSIPANSWVETFRLTATDAAESTAGQGIGTGLGGATDEVTNLPPYITTYMWRRTA